MRAGEHGVGIEGLNGSAGRLDASSGERKLRVAMLGLAFLALGAGVVAILPRGGGHAYQEQAFNCEDTLVDTHGDGPPILTPRTLDEARYRWQRSLGIDVRLEDIGGQEDIAGQKFDVIRAEDGACARSI